VPNHFILTPRLLPLEPAPGGRPLPRGIDPTSPQLLLRQGQDTFAIFHQEGNGLAVLDCGKGTWRELALVVEDRQGRRPYGRIDGRVLNILRDPVGEGLALLAGGSLATFTLGKTEAVLRPTGVVRSDPEVQGHRGVSADRLLLRLSSGLLL